MRYNFETALVWLKRGYKIRRASWNGGLCLQIIEGELHLIRQGLPLDVAIGAEEKLLSLEDILAEDWEVDDGKEI